MDPVTGSLLMGTIGNLVNVGSTVANNASMLRNAAEARAYNLQMAKMQNEYNSPVNQVSRLVAAGMNPHQAFGGSPTPAASVGEVTPPHLDAPFVDTTSMMNAYLGNALQNRELDYKFAALDEQIREFNHLEGIEGHGASSRLKDAQTRLAQQQYEFNEAAKDVLHAMDDAKLKELNLNNEYIEKSNKLKLEFEQWRNKFQKDLGSHQLKEAEYRNIILGYDKDMKAIDAGWYDVLSNYKEQLMKAGVDKAQLDAILTQTNKNLRDQQIEQLKVQIEAQKDEYAANHVHVPWLDYSLDVIGSLVSMVTSFIPFANTNVKSSSKKSNNVYTYGVSY